MRNLDFSSVRKVVIRSTNWIGDAVMTTPAMGAVRAALPDAEMVVAANPVVAELFSPHPYCDRVIVLDNKKVRGSIRGLFHSSSLLRAESFDLAILFQNAIGAAITALLAGIPNRAGYRTDGRGILLTHAVPIGKAQRRLHHTDYYLQMLARLGIEGGDERLALSCTERELALAGKMLRTDTGSPWVAVNPGAAFGSAKRWFPERFAEVADGLVREFGARILITGGPAEADLGVDIEAAMKARPLNLVGKTSVRMLMALLSQCSLMVTNDSGPMHVAAAFGVPVVALFGSTDHTTTSPLSSSCRIIRKDFPCAPCLKRICPLDHGCMAAITAQDVLEAARSLPWTGVADKSSCTTRAEPRH
jgi:heptosyltransferase-2